MTTLSLTMPTFDFVTADNAPVPHVKVYVVETERTVAVFPIEHGDVSEAEAYAEMLLEALKDTTPA